MPAKKSWDVRREPAKSAKGGTKVTRPRKSGAARRASSKSLKQRRSTTRNIALALTMLVVVAGVGGIVYLLWQPSVRVANVSADGEHASGIAMLTRQTLTATYFGIIPRNSIFVYPEREIRKVLLDAYPDISSLSISRSGFNSLSIKTNARVTAFWWCGTPSVEAPVDSTCYESDAEGFIFAPVEEGAVLATSTALSTLRIYGELAAASSSASYPLRAHMQHVESIPNALRFVHAMNNLNIPIVSLSIHNDEADVITPAGTRIIYVLGHEEDATELARATFSTLNLIDGSIQYVDLRFPAKVYVKRRDGIRTP